MKSKHTAPRRAIPEAKIRQLGPTPPGGSLPRGPQRPTGGPHLNMAMRRFSSKMLVNSR